MKLVEPKENVTAAQIGEGIRKQHKYTQTHKLKDSCLSFQLEIYSFPLVQCSR